MSCDGSRQKQNKILVCVQGNTIVHPRAMVIEPRDTFVAGPAMLATIWPPVLWMVSTTIAVITQHQYIVAN